MSRMTSAWAVASARCTALLPIPRELVTQFAGHFDFDAEEILTGRFVKLFPLYLRPYGRLYTY
jgi:hypothetical protein